MKNSFVLVVLLAIQLSTSPSSAAEVPKYKPSSRSPEPQNILTNQYGASRFAPNAIELGQKVPDFSIPRFGGGLFSLRQARSEGPVVIIFYRGHW